MCEKIKERSTVGVNKSTGEDSGNMASGQKCIDSTERLGDGIVREKGRKRATMENKTLV